MTKKEKIQKLFKDCGLTDQLMQLVMSGVLPTFAISDGLNEEVKKEKYLIIFQYALKAATDLYSDLFTVKEINELLAIYKRPVMKKIFDNSSNMVETVAKYLIANNQKIYIEIDKID